MKILIVEDEPAMAAGLEFNCRQEGYEVVSTGDGRTALDLFRQADPPFDLVILDLMLPAMSGYETLEEIRKTDHVVPVLVLSARTLSEDRMRAFDCGTDQYMTKPFALPELLSRIRNLTSRRPQPHRMAQGEPKVSLETYTFGEVQVDFRKYTVTVGERVQTLTALELQLLRYFVEHEGDVLPRLQILEDVWDDRSDITTRTIDNFVMRLRRLIEPDPSDPRHIVSVRGTGYRFVANPEGALHGC